MSIVKVDFPNVFSPSESIEKPLAESDDPKIVKHVVSNLKSFHSRKWRDFNHAEIGEAGTLKLTSNRLIMQISPEGKAVMFDYDASSGGYMRRERSAKPEDVQVAKRIVPMGLVAQIKVQVGRLVNKFLG